MLLPRYSIRWLLGLTTFAAGVSFVLSYAIRGHAWAIGVSAGLWSLVVVGVSYVVAFLAAWLIAQVAAVARQGSQGGGSSPFAKPFAGDVPLSPSNVPAMQPTIDSPPPMTG